MSYNHYWTRSNPGIIIILIDQSVGMSELLDDRKKSDIAADFVNCFIAESCNRFVNNGAMILPSAFISLIGYYDNKIKIIRKSSILEMIENPLKIDTYKKQISDGIGGFVEIDYSIPIQVLPKATGNKPMEKGFEFSMHEINEFIKRKNDIDLQTLIRPIVINICEGIPTNGLESVRSTVNKLSTIHIPSGSPIIINIVLGCGEKYIFPTKLMDLADKVSSAKLYFDISSTLPISIHKLLDLGFNVDEKSRYLFYNVVNDDLGRISSACHCLIYSAS